MHLYLSKIKIITISTNDIINLKLFLSPYGHCIIVSNLIIEDRQQKVSFENEMKMTWLM